MRYSVIEEPLLDKQEVSSEQKMVLITSISLCTTGLFAKSATGSEETGHWTVPSAAT